MPPSTPRRLKPLLAQGLALLLLLGPFLHAHFGASSITGFHLDGVAVQQASLVPPGLDAVFSADHGLESPAMGVGTAHPRVDEPPAPQPLLLAPCFGLGALLARALPVWRRVGQVQPGVPRRFAQPGHPPPAHAPPRF